MMPINQIEIGDPKDTKNLRNFYIQAKSFILNQQWCESIKDAFLGIGYEGILAVFLFRIVPEKLYSNDSEAWIIVGDIPPAHINPTHAINSACALLSYVGEMNLWVQAIKNNENLQNKYYLPVNVPPTLEYAKLLENRLCFIDKNILPEYSEDLYIGGYKEDFNYFPHYTK